MRVSVSTKIEKKDKERVQALVKKGTFDSMSEFYRTAIQRLLRDIDEYQEKKKRVIKEVFGKKEQAPEPEPDDEDLKDLQRFVDDLY